VSALITYNQIIEVLSGLGLREIPGLIDIDEVKESHKENGFILKPTGTDETELANKNLFTVYNWSLEIVFKHVNSLERVKCFDLFHSIKEAVQKIDGFKGFSSEPEFNRLANFNFLSVGTLTFQLGSSGC
jgi:hypothetical protein